MNRTRHSKKPGSFSQAGIISDKKLNILGRSVSGIKLIRVLDNDPDNRFENQLSRNFCSFYVQDYGVTGRIRGAHCLTIPLSEYSEVYFKSMPWGLLRLLKRFPLGSVVASIGWLCLG